MTRATCLYAVILVVVAAVPAVFASQNPPGDKVLQSLQTALSAENNARSEVPRICDQSRSGGLWGDCELVSRGREGGRISCPELLTGDQETRWRAAGQVRSTYRKVHEGES